ncbi:MAG: IclR family transcriptional regulator [Clostridiaceae bacterium]|nr:IclR family transcriptional regulator [Clostridiaceae bacterium]
MSNGNVQVLDRALSIIETLATAESGMGLSDIAERTELPKSTVHRILRTYCERHYVERNSDSGLYMLGYKYVELASIYLNALNLKTEAAPVMHELAMYFNATSYLGVFENNEVMYLECIEKIHHLRTYRQIGKREQLYCTALGKVLLSGFSKPQFEAVAKSLRFERLTPNTIITIADLEDEVEHARKYGYAVDRYEHTVAHSCFAVPIHDFTNNIIAAISVAAPRLLESHSIAHLKEKMSAAAAQISQRMGYITPSSS